MLLELNAYFGDRRIMPTSTAQIDTAEDNPSEDDLGGISASNITDLDTPLDNSANVSIDQIIAALQALKKFGLDTLPNVDSIQSQDDGADGSNELDADPGSKYTPTDPNDFGSADMDDVTNNLPVHDDDTAPVGMGSQPPYDGAGNRHNPFDNDVTFGEELPDENGDHDNPFEDDSNDGGENFANDGDTDSEDLLNDESDGTDTPETDPNKMGNIRVVKGAHLVYKRQSSDGTFNELWIYNVGDHIQQSIDIKKAIIAGTDIPDNQMRSKDNSQTYELVTMGNAQMLFVSGLPN